PAFHRQQINSFVQLMCDVADERLTAWKDGQMLDVSSEMTRLTVAIIGRAMLGSDLSGGADLIGETLRICMKYLQGDSVFRPPDWLQASRRRAYRAAVARIDELIYGLIARRKAMAERPDDLVTLLLEARLDDGTDIGDKQVRDELVNIFLA